MFVNFPEGIRDKDKIRIAKSKLETEGKVYIYPITNTVAIAYSQEEKPKEDAYLRVGRLIRKVIETGREKFVIIAQIKDSLYVVIKKGENLNTYVIPKKEDAFAVLAEDVKRVEPEVIYVAGDDEVQRWANEFFMTMNVKVAEAKVEDEDRARVIRERSITDELRERLETLKEKVFPSSLSGRELNLPVGNLPVDKRVLAGVSVALVALLGFGGYKLFTSQKKPVKKVVKRGPDYTNYYKNVAVLNALEELGSAVYVSYDGNALQVISPTTSGSLPQQKVGRYYVKLISVSAAKVGSKPQSPELPPLERVKYYSTDKGCSFFLLEGRAYELKRVLRGVLKSNAGVNFALSCSSNCYLELKVCGR